MKFDSPWWPALGALAFCLLAALGFRLVAHPPDMMPEAWAGWAQAVGTVAAIAVTQRIATRQRRHDIEREQLRVEALSEAVWEAARQAVEELVSMAEIVAPNDQPISRGRFQGQRGRLQDSLAVLQHVARRDVRPREAAALVKIGRLVEKIALDCAALQPDYLGAVAIAPVQRVDLHEQIQRYIRIAETWMD